MNTLLEQNPCPHCNTPMRPADKHDWKKGEKKIKGNFPHLLYWTCDNCPTTTKHKQKWIQWKPNN